MDERKEIKKRNGGLWVVPSIPIPPVHQGTHHPRPPRPLLAALSQDSQHKTNMHQNKIFLSEQMHSHSNVHYIYSATQRSLTGRSRRPLKSRLSTLTCAKTYRYIIQYSTFQSKERIHPKFPH